MVVWRQLTQLTIPPVSNERKMVQNKFLAFDIARGGGGGSRSGPNNVVPGPLMILAENHE